MKKMQFVITGFISLLAIPLSTHATRLTCPFTDYFAISVPINAVKIINLPTTQGNLRFTQQADTFFTLGCADDRASEGGDLSIDVGIDDANKCSFAIHDGPYVMNPTVTYVNCKGALLYKGIDHILGSYNYTIKLATS